MTEGQGDFAPRHEPKEIPVPVKLVELNAENPQHAQDFWEIDQNLSTSDFKTAQQEIEKSSQEIRDHAVPIPLTREDPDYSLAGVSYAGGPKAGGLAGWVSLYKRDGGRSLLMERGFSPSLLRGKKLREIAFGKHPNATVDQMAQGIKAWVEEVTRYYREAHDTSLLVTSDVKMNKDTTKPHVIETRDKEREALIAAGFTSVSVFNLRSDKEIEAGKKPQLWEVFVLDPAQSAPQAS